MMCPKCDIAMRIIGIEDDAIIWACRNIKCSEHDKPFRQVIYPDAPVESPREADSDAEV